MNKKGWIFVIYMTSMHCLQQMLLLLLNALMFLVFSLWSDFLFMRWEINFYEINYEANYVNSMTELDLVTGIYVCWETTFQFLKKPHMFRFLKTRNWKNQDNFNYMQLASRLFHSVSHWVVQKWCLAQLAWTKIMMRDNLEDQCPFEEKFMWALYGYYTCD